VSTAALQQESTATRPRWPTLGRKTIKRLADAVVPSKLLVSRGPTRAKRVALTFDDGPAELTRDYLDLLDRYGVKATFFLVGAACAQRPSDAALIAARGHEIASHGYTHRTFPTLGRDELLVELERTEELLPSGRPRLVRPPRGAVSVSSLVTCAMSGYTTVLWSYDSDDCRTSTAAEVESAFAQTTVRPGEILLFHEGQQWTLAALPAILQHLTEEGHELVTISELLGG
jgi:peptidoglycan/xylan/chitin deacetylase (PgdA/CDA1 family)